MFIFGPGYLRVHPSEAIVSTRDVHTSEANASTEYTSPFEQPTSQHARRQRLPPSRVSCAPRLLPTLFAQKTRKNNACSAGYFHLEFALVLSRSVRVKSKHKHKGTFALQKVEVCGLRACAYVCFCVTHVRGLITVLK